MSWLVDIIFGVINWYENLKRAQDPFEAQYKGYQIAMLRSGLFMLILSAGAWLIIPADTHTQGFTQVIKPIFEMVFWGYSILMMLAFVVFMWQLIGFMWFCHKHGIGE